MTAELDALTTIDYGKYRPDSMSLDMTPEQSVLFYKIQVNLFNSAS